VPSSTSAAAALLCLSPPFDVRVVLIIIIYQLPSKTITNGREIVIWVLLDFGRTPNNSLRRSRNKRHPTLSPYRQRIIYLHPPLRHPHLWYYLQSPRAMFFGLSIPVTNTHTSTLALAHQIDPRSGRKLAENSDKSSGRRYTVSPFRHDDDNRQSSPKNDYIFFFREKKIRTFRTEDYWKRIRIILWCSGTVAHWFRLGTKYKFDIFYLYTFHHCRRHTILP